MVPHRENPPGGPNAFSIEVETALEEALLEPWTSGAPPDALRRALTAAAREARAKMLRAEEMLIAFKQLEQRVARTAQARSSWPVPDRTRVIRALIDAYYLDD